VSFLQQLYHLHLFNTTTLGQKTTAAGREFWMATTRLEKNVGVIFRLQDGQKLGVDGNKDSVSSIFRPHGPTMSKAHTTFWWMSKCLKWH